MEFIRKEEIRMKKEKEKKAREEQALQNYMLRISEENLKKAEADEIIRSLEREERRLLEKINSAQEKQEKVGLQMAFIVHSLMDPFQCFFLVYELLLPLLRQQLCYFMIMYDFIDCLFGGFFFFS